MTLKDMINRLENFCNSKGSCSECPVNKLPYDFCFGFNHDNPAEVAMFMENYKAAFGEDEPKEEIPKSQHTVPSGLDFRRKATDKVRITLTRSQCESIAEFIELELLNTIRADKEIDNVDWLADMMNAYVRLKKLGEYDD